MKTHFFGYYPPTEAEYERLWKEGLVVVDTNVLLNLYRLPTTARDELFEVLNLLKERLWIPYQVALEFQRRRLTVIAAERKATEDALQTASDLVAELRRKVDTLQIDKRGLGVQSQPLLDDLEKANSKLIDAIKEVHRSQLDISSSDSVRDRLDLLLRDRIGPGPTTQKELDDLSAQGDDRFKEKIPPGFADADKDKNPNEATFIHDQLKYQRKFGDLILWRQVIEHVKASGAKCVLFVTADRKEDWWWREQGKTIGPHPELVREIIKQGNVELYWMYSSVQFVEHANKYSAATVSSQSVAELKQVALAPRMEAGRDYQLIESATASRLMSPSDPYLYMDRPDLRHIERLVAEWLQSIHDDVRPNQHGFPDFIAIEGEDVHGFEVKYVRNFDRMVTSPSIVNSLLRGYMETREGRLSEFTAILVVSEIDFFDIAHSDRVHELNRRLAHLLGRYPITGIVVGAILGERFEPLVYQRERDGDTD
ncbi:hypothetical protein ATF69_0272 [Acidovorax delafieldii]|uniref:PIN like domain-containing protein n=1 Tax=Acidovorax delafieldii TaxID=47920 RepID=A0A561XXZ3_ACIDE|nr:PIN domain-containing protein [Acidovorax delafieldii]TWG40983.1 hypothetical protein ATF69_0272 [Acidovorax delafieldii]